MNFWMPLLNGFAVSIFGSVLSATFCNALTARRNRLIFWGGMVLLLLLQSLVFICWGALFFFGIFIPWSCIFLWR